MARPRDQAWAVPSLYRLLERRFVVLADDAERYVRRQADTR